MTMKRALLGIGAVAVALGVAGCSTAVANNSSTSSATANTGAASTTTSNSVLTIGGAIQGSYTSKNFNPFVSTSIDTKGLIYEPLFYVDMVNNKTWSLLGEKYAWSKGSTVLTVQLRHGVKWSDGKPFTANDVAFSFNIIKKYPAADQNGVWGILKSVQVVNPYTVRFTLQRPDVPDAVHILEQPIVPQHIWSKVKGDVTKTLNSNPVGTGPYVLGQFSPQAVFFRANPNYWGGKPAVSEVKVPVYSTNEVGIMAIEQGEVDWGGTPIPGIQKQFVSRDPAHNHYWYPTTSNVLLYTNLSDPTLKDLAVRKAISAAINREQLSMLAENGFEPVATPTGLLSSQKSFQDPSLPKSDNALTFSPSQAEKDLTADGYKKDGSGFFAKDGKEINLTITTVAGWTDYDQIASMIAQNLKSVGINASVQEGQYNSVSSELSAHKYQLAVLFSNSGPGPYFFYDGLLNPSSSMDYEGYQNSSTTALLQQYAAATTMAGQKKIAYKLESIVANDLPSIPLLQAASWYEYNTTRFTGWPSQTNPYADPMPGGMDEGIILTHLKPVK
ncbi:ABC transporter substrate-binding protein [Alicyclobacillus fastidiosus]|uniref:ABC transporter substrate-binding protein n=1 Tax=Alicyclobacillus fastidiosus TaxID=392011 RepID=A0ABY6ZH04_9BACL|nr:ABC transporter substrate-binding protein [Alicyclobacillus fastidiosus]WAH41381.1 ABC transporter substrate-binding protein [Alicyclobacillus fastidiosus]GMA62995.1 peptide ABC transporter substrate-binding protein [Alicyclobacillus fastidiosus]